MVHISRFERKPWIDTRELGNLWRIPVEYGIYRAASHIANYLQKSQEATEAAGQPGRLQEIAHSVFNSIGDKYKKEFTNHLDATFGQFVVQYQFAVGPSSIEKLYTMAIEGYEVPVAVKGDAEDGPTMEAIKEGVKYVLLHRESPLTAKVSLDTYYRSEFERALQQYSRGDASAQLIDPSKFQGWLVRDHTWIIQQCGPSTSERVEVEGKEHTIHTYTAPPVLPVWLYWSLGDKIYDAVDVFYDNIQRTLEAMIDRGLLTDNIRQLFTEEEYKYIATIRRALFFQRSPGLTYNLKGAKKKPKAQAHGSGGHAPAGHGAPAAPAGQPAGHGGHAPHGPRPLPFTKAFADFVRRSEEEDRTYHLRAA